MRSVSSHSTRWTVIRAAAAGKAAEQDEPRRADAHPDWKKFWADANALQKEAEKKAKR